MNRLEHLFCSLFFPVLRKYGTVSNFFILILVCMNILVAAKGRIELNE